MDTTIFRWILVIIGFAIIGVILFGNPDRKRKPRAGRKRASAARMRREPDAGAQDGEQAELAIGDRDDSEGRVEPRFDSANDGEAQEDKPPAPEVPPPDKIVTLFLLARDNHVITGVDLLDASLKSGLVFGERDIFHRINEEDLQPVFSMASLTNPGTFDKTAWNTIEIMGVTMFMTLPGPVNALDAWDSMLATSRRLAELLHADLLDDARSVFTRQRALQIKDELRAYERQKIDQP